MLQLALSSRKCCLFSNWQPFRNSHTCICNSITNGVVNKTKSSNLKPRTTKSRFKKPHHSPVFFCKNHLPGKYFFFPGTISIFRWVGVGVVAAAAQLPNPRTKNSHFQGEFPRTPNHSRNQREHKRTSQLPRGLGRDTFYPPPPFSNNDPPVCPPPSCRRTPFR